MKVPAAQGLGDLRRFAVICGDLPSWRKIGDLDIDSGGK
jgi:hypothetical protein